MIEAGTPPAVRTCRCGCGTPLRTPFSEFAPGHNMRVARMEGPQGSALPVRPRHVLPCLQCGREMTVTNTNRPWKYCSRECLAASRLTLKGRAWNALQLRCFRYMTTHGLGVAPFCRAAGINANTFRSWVRARGQPASRPTLTALARLLDITEERALAEADGITAEERRQEVTRRLVALESWRLANTPEARAKKSATQTGRTRPPEVVEKMRAASRAPEVVARARARMRLRHMNTPTQALARLGLLLRWEPSPTAAQRKEWEARVARELAVKPRVIRSIWHDTLVRRELIKESGGRPLLEHRHRVLEEFMEEQGLRPEHPKPRGFWNEAADRVNERDPRNPTDGPALRLWYLSHLQRCPRAYFAAKVAQGGQA